MKNRLLKTICLPFLLLFILLFLFSCTSNPNNISSSSSMISSTSSSVLSSNVSSSQQQVSSSAAVVYVQKTVSRSAILTASIAASKAVTPNSTSSTKSSRLKPSKYITLTIDATKGYDGIVAKNKQVAIITGDTVYSMLKRYCITNKILISAQKTGNGEYVSSIDGVGQFDNGSESGWIYSVGGKFLSVDCNSYKLSSGETVKWVYTTDDGKTEEHNG